MLLQVLLLVPGEVHEVHQSQRIHHDRNLREEFLLVGQGVILTPYEKRCQVKVYAFLERISV